MDLAQLVAQIGKPLKELSSWDFSMEEFLKKYHAILDSNDEVDFLKAGIILETLSCVHSRRVDSLHECAVSWKISNMEEKESEEQDKSKAIKSRKSRKLVFDLDDFEKLDFKSDIGKNINIKNLGKGIKLLHRQFAQLELSQGEKADEMIDVNGETIGKTYSFRINQPVTKSGMLVKQLTQKCYIEDSVNAASTDTKTTEKVVSPQTSSGYYSEFSEIDIESEIEPMQIVSEDQYKTTELSKATNGTMLSDSGYYELDKTNDEGIVVYEGKDDENLGDISTDILNDKIVVNDLPHVEEQEETVFSDTENVDDGNDVHDPESEKEDENDVHNPELEKEDKIEETNNIEENPTELEKEDDDVEDKENKDENGNVEEGNESLELEKEKEAVKVVENDKSEEKPVTETKKNCTREKIGQEVENPRKRKRTPKTNLVNVLDENHEWTPISFDEGVPDKPKNPRKKFKLPSHTDLLKKKPRKRGLPMEDKIENSKVGKTASKKLDTHSPAIFSPLKNDEIRSYTESLELIAKEQQCSIICSTIMLGCQKNLTKPALQMDSPISCTSYDGYTVVEPEEPEELGEPEESEEPEEIETPEEPELCFPEPSDSYNTPPRTPHEFQPVASSSVIGSRISEKFNNEVLKQKVTERLGKTDERTELEKNVAKWHETLKPKLIAAENRSSFTINHYKSKIENALSKSEGKKIAFKDVVKDEPVSEVARFFLSSLQMANTYSVDIRRSPDHELELALIEKKQA